MSERELFRLTQSFECRRDQTPMHRLKRNRELSEALEKSKSPAQDALVAIENGINTIERNRITQQLASAQKAVLEPTVGSV